MSETTPQVYTRRPLSTTIRATVWDRSGGVCHHCGKELHPIRDFHVDHVTPVVAGGTDDLGNLVAACVLCNLRKGGKRPPRAPLRDLGTGTVSAERSARFLTVAEVAARIDRTPATVKRWLRDGKMAGVMLGDRAGWRVAEDDLHAYLRQQGNIAYIEERKDEGGKEAA